ncbi:MAG TPA: phage baseplate assembly protein V [Acidiphilium sp.]|nr:phage baseplate assembly protein V [Acidiphilium sp.]
MEAFNNAMKRAALAMDRQMGHPRYGIVESYDPNKATAKVTLQPDGVLTGWLPVAVMWMGNGWGLLCPPSPGDQVVVLPQGGDPEDLVVMGCVFSPQGTPAVSPPATPSGELWLVHQSGAFIKLLNSGGIASNGTWTHTGQFTASQDIIAGFGGSDQVGLQTHKHDQPSDSAGDAEAITTAPIAGT